MEIQLAVIGSQAYNHQIQRHMTLKSNRQRHLSTAVRLKGIVVNRCAPSHAFLYHIILLSQKLLQNTGPADISFVTSSFRIGTKGIGISKTQNRNHLAVLLFLWLQNLFCLCHQLHNGVHIGYFAHLQKIFSIIKIKTGSAGVNLYALLFHCL